MDEQRFGALVRTAKTRVGRRDVMKGVAAGVVALLVGEARPAAARRRRLKRTFRCPGPADTTFSRASGSGDRARQAQVFLAGRSGSLRRIAVGLVEAPNTTGDYVIQLVAVSGSPNGLPSRDPADVLAKATIKDKNVPVGPKTVIASFSGPKLIAGTEYAVVIDRIENTTMTTQVRQSQDDDGAACPNSRMFSAVGTAEYQPALTFDMVMSVSVA